MSELNKSELNMSEPVEIVVETIVSPEYGFYENCYLVYRKGASDCVVIDPGFNASNILARLKSLSVAPLAILCTHGHFDHVFGITELKNQWPSLPVYIGNLDADKLTDPHGNMSADFGKNFTVPSADFLLNDGDAIEAAGLKFNVLLTPGHSAGHVTYVNDQNEPNLVFCGDVLFRDSVGRSDFYDGNGPTLVKSILEKLMTLPDSAIVYSGHGPSTTIGREKFFNPYF